MTNSIKSDIKSISHYMGFMTAYADNEYNNPFSECDKKHAQARIDYSKGYTDGVMEMLRCEINKSLNKS